MTKESILEDVHKALHTPSMNSVTIGGLLVPIYVAPNGCRSCDLNDTLTGHVRVIAQNAKKSSSYAQRARNGETISWIMPLNEHNRVHGGWTSIETPVTDLAKKVVTKRTI